MCLSWLLLSAKRLVAAYTGGVPTFAAIVPPGTPDLLHLGTAWVVMAMGYLLATAQDFAT